MNEHTICLLIRRMDRLTFPRNRLDQHLGDFVLNVCENIMDQLKVNADAKLNTFCRRRPLGVNLNKLSFLYIFRFVFFYR